MRKQTFVRIGSALAVVSPALCAEATRAADEVRRPNIVLIVADDQGWNSVGYRGGWVRTPHIDRLADQGV